MKEVYKDIWKLAKPYYEKGRPNDIEHINWMMKDAMFICEEENIDDSLLLPLVILHDVGYRNIESGNPLDLNLRKAHMEEGEKISRNILMKLNYNKDKINQISYYVSVHDNWALGEDKIYKEDLILGVFNDLDFMWMATLKGFSIMKNILRKDKKAMVEYLENEEKLIKRPFSTKTTKSLFGKYLNERKKEI